MFRGRKQRTERLTEAQVREKVASISQTLDFCSPNRSPGLCLLSQPQTLPPDGRYDELHSVFRKTPWGPILLLSQEPGQYFPCIAAHTSRIRRSWSALPSLTPAHPLCLAVPAVCSLQLSPWPRSHSQLTQTPSPLAPKNPWGLAPCSPPTLPPPLTRTLAHYFRGLLPVN